MQLANACNVTLIGKVHASDSCTLHETFGCESPDTMWVARGCRGAFHCNGHRNGLCGIKGVAVRTLCSCSMNATARTLQTQSAKQAALQQAVPPAPSIVPSLTRGSSSSSSSCSAAERFRGIAEAIEARLSLSSINASRSRVLAGNMSALRTLLQQRGCLRERPPLPPPLQHGSRSGSGRDAGTRGVLRIKVLGGSMTAGRMNCHEALHVPCTGVFTTRHLSWPALLEAALSRLLPGCNVRVTNLATPGNRMTLFLDATKRRVYVDEADDLVISGMLPKVDHGPLA